MKKLLLGVLMLCAFVPFAGAEPLRVYIRSGPKTHGPGAHDHPAFLRDWTKLLNERGAKATGGDTFPTAEQLAATDVLVLHAEEAGNIEGEDRKNLEAYLNRGGGVVALHGGAVSKDADWFKTVVGGSWRFGKTKWLEGHLSLYFTDRENPITKDLSNFDLDDEIYYDMDVLPDVKVLAAAFTPKPKDGAHADEAKRVNIYDIQPQMWTYETGNRRAFVSIPGHLYENFSHVSMRTLLLRGIAWAGKRGNADELCKPEELGDALRYPVGGPIRPEKAAEKIELHPEFDISLVAAEPLINKVLNVDWDEKGRMWVVESPEYPNGLRKANTDEWKESGSFSPGNYEREPLDRISILTDTNGDGLMDKKHVFADKLELATGFVFHKNGVIVSAAPDIWFLEDTDGDEICDKRTKLYTGLGTRDTHAVMNNLRWGVDGWIYATHGYSAGDVTALGAEGKKPVTIGSGVVRFRPDGTEIEMFSSKNGNTWGLCMTSDGQCFWTQPTSGILLFHTLLPEWVLSKGRVPGTNGWKGLLAGEKVNPLMKWEQLAYVQIDLVGTYTAAAGCAIYEGGAWPEKWNRGYFTGEPTVNLVSHYELKPDGPSYSAKRAPGREDKEFIRSSDLWFRPVENRVGPDGALYVVDFYNQAVIHNDTRGPKHGPANAAVRPDRDHYFGRIWKVQHKQAKKIEVPVIDRSKASDLIKASSSENGHTRMTAIRLMRESGLLKDAPANGSIPFHAYEKAAGASDEKARKEVISSFLSAEDDWTKSALIAAASAHAFDFIDEILVSEDAAKLGDLAAPLVQGALANDAQVSAAKLIVNSAAAPARANAIKAILLESIAARSEIKPELNAELLAAFGKLLDDPVTGPWTLPLAAKWDTAGKLADQKVALLKKLAARMADGSATEDDRVSSARALVLAGDAKTLDSVVALLTDEKQSEGFRKRLLALLGETGRAEAIAGVFGKLSPSLRTQAFDLVLARPEASLVLLDGVESGSLKADAFGPGNIARLRSHPDRKVSERAGKLADKLNPGGKAKAEIIAKLLPEVVKPGNVETGKALFSGACAVCHKLDDLGTHDVGPPLTGMGSHGAAELLVHIVDPNREVDPSFWQWNITTKDGSTFAGVIVSENAATITLRSQGGDSEIRKSDIATRENTHRSLMPEGLEGLGAEGIRDILSYMVGDDARYRVVDLRDAYTADGRRGLFASEEAKSNSVFPKSYGDVKALEIPFFLMDPARSANGRNLVVLKGGGKDDIASTYPQSIEIPVNLEASRFYLLSGIAGWGYPATRDFRPAMEVTLHFADGRKEQTVLLNGQAFADYIAEENVSGSKLVPDIVKRGQLRMIRVDVKKPGVVTKIGLKSFNNGVTPVLTSITADLSKEAATVETAEEIKALDLSDPKTTAPTGQRFAEPKKGLRVLLAGAGSSHDFPRFFMKEDSEILKAAGLDVAATTNAAEAIALMADADVIVFSGNDPQYAMPQFMRALNGFADSGKGVVALHAATWYNYPPETGYNRRFVGGGTRSHGKGDFEVTVVNKDHPVTKGVAPRFTIFDESYRMEIADAAGVEILAENLAEGKTHPSVWVKKDAKAKIVGITLGHDERAHGNPDFRKLLANAVKWVGEN